MSGTVCLAVYRPDEDLLRAQIDSIRSQTLEGWECVIGIDGTDENARHAVERIVGDDSRFRVIEYGTNVGFYRNFERLLGEVRTGIGWVALSDQDDLWYTRKLELLVPLLDDADLAFGQAVVVSPGRPDSDAVTTSRRSTTMAAAVIDNQVTGSIAVFRSSLLETALPMPAPTDSAFHDHWLGVCALAGRGIAVLDDAVQDYVQHGGNVIGEERRRTLGQRLGSLSRRSGGGARAGLDFISAHRWGWRVNMARTLLTRADDVPAAASSFLSAVARNRLTPALTIGVLREIMARRVPPLRAVALLAGAWRAPGLARAASGTMRRRAGRTGAIEP